MTTREAMEGLSRAQAKVNRAQRELLLSILQCELLSAHREDDCRDAAQWVSLRLGINQWKARRLVACARALEELPVCEQAFVDGLLSLDKLVELTRLASPQTEKKLVIWARRVAIATIRDRADEARRISLDAVRDAEKWRSFGWSWSEDHTRLYLEGSLPAADGANVVKAIERLAETMPVMPGAEGDSAGTFEARRADALVALAAQAISSDPDPDRATVVVHVSLETLLGEELGGAVNGVFEGGRPLSAEAVGRLVCDSRIQALLEEGGRVTGIGFTSREVPARLRRALERRDNFRCTFPGCGRQAHLHAHHVVPWPLGPTDLDNLALVCSFHHRLVHEGGWHITLRDGMTDWFRPDWTPYVSRAGPVVV
jgi:hypothetical protein